jgi:hypothetical protein
MAGMADLCLLMLEGELVIPPRSGGEQKITHAGAAEVVPRRFGRLIPGGRDQVTKLYRSPRTPRTTKPTFAGRSPSRRMK